MKQLSNPPPRKRWWQLIDSQLMVWAIIAIMVSGSFIFSGIAKIFGGPEIVVYLDKDAKQPAILPLPETQVVSGERAALWWTVFNEANKTANTSDARYIANNAVEVVYGPAEPAKK